MTAVFNDYLPILIVALIVALIIGAITGFLLFRPRQRVRLSDGVPDHLHMSVEQRHPVPDAIPPTTKRPGTLDGAAAAIEEMSGLSWHQAWRGSTQANDDAARLHQRPG